MIDLDDVLRMQARVKIQKPEVDPEVVARNQKMKELGLNPYSTADQAEYAYHAGCEGYVPHGMPGVALTGQDEAAHPSTDA